ncbi:MAG TPA: hypothetical protein VJA16_10275 [Thermoanaerobaculia bacterium]
MQPHEARRLTGPNLLSYRPGAVLDVLLGGAAEEGADAEARIAAWRRHARRMLDVLGWRDEELAVRRFASGASLFASAPIDALYTATDVVDWAWEAAGAAVPDSCAFEAAAERLRLAAAGERQPALLALRDAAAARGVAFLADDDRVTVGLGTG